MTNISSILALQNRDNATQVMETSEAELMEIEKDKKIIYAIQPHGVMSIAGICAGIHLVSSVFDYVRF